MTPVAPIPARKYGRMYGGDRPWITDTGLQVWMWRKGQKVRFLTATGKQIGPTHANVYPAMNKAIGISEPEVMAWYRAKRLGLWLSLGNGLPILGLTNGLPIQT